MSDEIVKAAVFRSHFEAVEAIPDESDQLAYLKAIVSYQLDGKMPEGLSPIVKALMTAILPVLDKEAEFKQGRPECDISAEEIAAKKEELGSAKAVADFYGIGERTVYRKLSELPTAKTAKTAKTPSASHCQTLPTAKTAKTNEERRMKNEEGENEEREKEREGAQGAHEALQAAPAPLAFSSDGILFPQEPPPPKQKRFVPPTVEEVAAYCNERGNGIDAESFVAFYESKGWFVGKNKMKDWRQAVVTWERRDKERKEAEARASPAPAYQHWEAPERPELSDEEREQALAVLRGTVKGLAKRKAVQLGGAR